MYHIIYMSQATRPMTTDELADLLAHARRANEQRGITGALVYGDGHFIQIMEGEQAVLAETYARIAQDPRHRNLFKVADKAIAARSFAEWSMAFQVVSPAQITQLAGYVEPGQLEQYLPLYGPADALFLDYIRELVRPPFSEAAVPTT